MEEYLSKKCEEERRNDKQRYFLMPSRNEETGLLVSYGQYHVLRHYCHEWRCSSLAEFIKAWRKIVGLYLCDGDPDVAYLDVMADMIHEVHPHFIS